MSRLFLALATLIFTVAVYGQGAVVFANRVGNVVDAPVLVIGTQDGPGPDFTAQLFLQVAEGEWSALAPASTSRPRGTGAAAIADRYWVSQDVIVPGVPSGTPAMSMVRAWRTSVGSFEQDAEMRGQSQPFTVTVGGGILPPSNLMALQSFTVGVIPEPSMLAIGVLGAALLLGRRSVALVRFFSLLVSSVCVFGQGQLVFDNKVGNIVDAPVLVGGTQNGPGPGWTAQLWLESSGGSPVPLAPMTTFGAPGPGAAAIADRYFADAPTITVPGVLPGESATFVLRAHRTSLGTYDMASPFRGESAPFTIVLGGGLMPPANMVTLQSFQVFVWPEPSPIVLGAIGAVFLFFLRRR